MRAASILASLVFTAVLALPGAAMAQEFPTDPYGDCCVAKVAMISWNSWDATCGDCATNPGVYRITQPDPEYSVYVDASGQKGDSPYDLAVKLCNCPSLDRVRALRKALRTYHGD